MSSHPTRFFRTHFFRTHCAILTLCLLMSTAALRADDLQETTSLKFVPANAAFYGATLRMREQWELLANSRAVAKLLSLKTVRMLKDGFNEAPQAQGALGAASTEEGQAALQLLGELVSDEVFVIGDAHWGGFQESINELQLAMQEVTTSTNATPVAEALEKFKLPSLLIGFRLRTPDLAKDALAKLEAAVQEQLTAYPDLAKRFSRTKLAGGEFLTWKLDGGLIPWDQAPQINGIDDLRETFTKKSIVFSVGLRGNYLLSYFGPTNSGLEQLGKGPLLYDLPEFARLRKHASEKIVSVGYTSAELSQNPGFGPTLAKLKSQLQPLLTVIGTSEETSGKIWDDLDELRAALKPSKAKPGVSVSFGFLSPHGYTGFDEDWNEHPEQDGSQPLSILQHVGGSPLAVCATRTRFNPDDYQLLVRVIAKVYENVDRVLQEKLEADEDEDNLAQYAKLKEVALPLVKRLEQATGTKLNPALQDGQSAFVIDARLTSPAWHPLLPKSDKPLPLLEPALLFGVSDAELLKKGIAEYVAVINTAMTKLHEELPDQFPDWTVPEPLIEKTAGGTHYSYPLKDVGADPQLQPEAFVTKTLAGLTLSRAHAERLAVETPLKLEGPAGKADRPLAAVSYLNFAGMIDVLDAWVVYGAAQAEVRELLKQANDLATPSTKEDEDEEDSEPAKKAGDDKKGDGEEKPALTPQDLVGDIRGLLSILKCARGHSSATYLEGPVTVTHSEWYYKDLAK